MVEGGPCGRPTALAGVAFLPKGRLLVALAVRARRGSAIIKGSYGQGECLLTLYYTTIIITVFTLIDNLVRLVILQAAKHQQVDVERSSFIDALRWLGAPDSGVPLEALFVNPSHPNRVEPRVQKRRPKKYPCMIKPRHVLRKQLIQQAV